MTYRPRDQIISVYVKVVVCKKCSAFWSKKFGGFEKTSKQLNRKGVRGSSPLHPLSMMFMAFQSSIFLHTQQTSDSFNYSLCLPSFNLNYSLCFLSQKQLWKKTAKLPYEISFRQAPTLKSRHIK